MPTLAVVLVTPYSITTLAVIIRLARPGPRNEGSSDRFDLGYGLTIASMLLLCPLGWMYYFPVPVLPGDSVWATAGKRRMRRHAAVLAIARVLSSITTDMVKAAGTNEPAAWFTSNGVHLYALVVFAGVVASMLRALNDRLQPETASRPRATSSDEDRARHGSGRSPDGPTIVRRQVDLCACCPVPKMGGAGITERAAS